MSELQLSMACGAAARALTAHRIRDDLEAEEKADEQTGLVGTARDRDDGN